MVQKVPLTEGVIIPRGSLSSFTSKGLNENSEFLIIQVQFKVKNRDLHVLERYETASHSTILFAVSKLSKIIYIIIVTKLILA